MCGPRTIRTGIAWELLRKTDSQASSQPYLISTDSLTRPPVTPLRDSVWKAVVCKSTHADEIKTRPLKGKATRGQHERIES